MLRPTLTHPARHQARHLAHRLLGSHTGFQPADHRKKVRAATAWIGGIEFERQQDLNLVVTSGRECKVSRHHADNGRCFRVDLNLFTDNVTGAAKTFLPESMRNDGDVWATIAIFLFSKVAATLWWHTQDVD